MQETAQPANRQRLIIRPATGWAHINLRELLHYRDLLLVLAARDLKLRYRQTALGPVWIVLQPLLAAGVFSFVFGKVASMKAPDGITGLTSDQTLALHPAAGRGRFSG